MIARHYRLLIGDECQYGRAKLSSESTVPGLADKKTRSVSARQNGFRQRAEVRHGRNKVFCPVRRRRLVVYRASGRNNERI
ncbi:hypothetical protein GWI33_016934 [Rhynchophorus ferrugineus]|uniref:Uncharacterized protein n=1 Tax=Rhynchophorus ferrugineus TaxID=354439 RepID=A0A834M6N9_RHYFE|nr:hypothetical protein GWI33_016934 [Rhynchophorus ferrugineus]